MHEDEIKSISATMAQLGAIRPPTVDALCLDFLGSFGNAGGILGSLDRTENLLLKALPKNRVTHIMEEIRGPAGRTMWDKLGNVNEEILANYLKNEYPQTVSVVLSMIKSDHAAKVLALLPDVFAMEVIMRMLKMEAIQKDVLERVERILRAEFMSNLARTSRKDPHQLIADVFNHFDRSTEQKFLKGLEERNLDSAERVKSQMFTFSDIQRLSPVAIGRLLREIDKGNLATALKGANDATRNLFFSQLSERSSKLLKDEIATLGPVKVRDVEEAQGDIANLAKELALRGDIDISVNSDDRVIE
jgi:flagellar motor switch protein FliG